MTDRTAAPLAQDRPKAEVSACIAEDYLAFQRYLETTSGILLGPAKEALVASRLTQLMLEHEVASLGEMVRALENGGNSRLRTAVIDAVTTTESGWFGDPVHFQILTEEILPTLQTSRTRIWSAGCATGQEPYSISMAVQDYLKANRGRFASGVEIVATDIARAALDHARRGVYHGTATRGLSDEHRRRYLAPTSGDCFSVRQEIRQRVVFREFNLARGLDVLGHFDVIFCRNVLVYFGSELRRAVLARLARALNDGGVLLLGATEQLGEDSAAFEACAAHGGTFFRKK